MKRVFAGIGWFFAVYIGTLAFAGMIWGIIFQIKTGDASYAAGHAAGREFGQRFGGLVFLFSMAFAIAGTWGRVLPGTRAAREQKPARETRAKRAA